MKHFHKADHTHTSHFRQLALIDCLQTLIWSFSDCQGHFKLSADHVNVPGHLTLSPRAFFYASHFLRTGASCRNRRAAPAVESFSALQEVSLRTEACKSFLRQGSAEISAGMPKTFPVERRELPYVFSQRTAPDSAREPFPVLSW